MKYCGEILVLLLKYVNFDKIQRQTKIAKDRGEMWRRTPPSKVGKISQTKGNFCLILEIFVDIKSHIKRQENVLFVLLKKIRLRSFSTLESNKLKGKLLKFSKQLLAGHKVCGRKRRSYLSL